MGFAYLLASTSQWVPLLLERDVLTSINVFTGKSRGNYRRHKHRET